MKIILFWTLLFFAAFSTPIYANEFGEEEDVFIEESIELFDAEEESNGSSRFTLVHEHSYKSESPTGTVNQRASFRMEYSRFFADRFYLKFDGKANLFFPEDHKSKAKESDFFPDAVLREVFLQSSFGNISLKAGWQILVWGEADGRAITDVISPRDQSELFFITLEESRISQAMLLMEYFSDAGEWSLFYIPNPEGDKSPEEGTAYYVDPFVSTNITVETSDKEKRGEFGFRWKKTFGPSDISLMYASLIDNQNSYDTLGVTPNFELKLERSRQPFQLHGLTFNYVNGSILSKGEIALKSDQSYNDQTYHRIKKNIIDAALGLEYSPGGRYTLALDVSNRHIIDWDKTLINSHEDETSLAFSWSKNFLNEDLKLRLASSYTPRNRDRLFFLEGDYQFDDHLKLEAKLFWIEVEDSKSPLQPYQNQNRITTKISYQF